jgi:hypothetical protein
MSPAGMICLPRLRRGIHIIPAGDIRYVSLHFGQHLYILSLSAVVPEENFGLSLGALNMAPEHPYEFHWVTSQIKLTYDRWAPTQPDLEKGRTIDQQLSMWSTENYCLDDADLNKPYGYICEYTG